MPKNKVPIGQIEPIFLNDETTPEELIYHSQGRNYRVMTKRGWSYVFGFRTAFLVAQHEKNESKQ